MTNTRTVVLSPRADDHQNQELRLSFIDVNAKPKVKLVVVKRRYKKWHATARSRQGCDAEPKRQRIPEELSYLSPRANDHQIKNFS